MMHVRGEMRGKKFKNCRGKKVINPFVIINEYIFKCRQQEYLRLQTIRRNPQFAVVPRVLVVE